MEALAFAIDSLREELGLSVPDLADRIDHEDDANLWAVLNGDTAMSNEIAWRCVAAMADVMRYRDAAGEALTHA